MIDDDHSARSIWEMIGRLDLSLYVAKIAAVEGRVGRDHTAPQLLISLWLYAYSQGVSSAREIARRCEYEPAFQWLCNQSVIELCPDFVLIIRTRSAVCSYRWWVC
jgi:transposase